MRGYERVEDPDQEPQLQDGSRGQASDRKQVLSEMRQEIRLQFDLAWPIALASCAQSSMMMTDLMFVGRLGAFELNAAGISATLWNLMWYALLGTASALDTLGAQAEGAGDGLAVKTWTVVATGVLFLLCVPMGLVLLLLPRWACESVLHTDHDTAVAVRNFCWMLLPGMFPAALSTTMIKYLTVRGVVGPVGVVAVLGFLMNIAFNALFIPPLGLIGSPLASTASRLFQALALCLYCYYRPFQALGPEGSFQFRAVWSKITFSVVRQFWRLGLDGLLMLATEVCLSLPPWSYS